MRGAIAAVALVLACGTNASAQSPVLRTSLRELLTASRSTVPPAPPQLTWLDALALLIRHNQVLARGREEVRVAEGRWREARGLFDPVLSIGPGGQYVHEPLDPSIFALEIDRRNRLQIVGRVFDEINRGVREQLASNTPRPPFCPSVFTLDGARIGLVPSGRVATTGGFRFEPQRQVNDGFSVLDGIIKTPFGNFRLSDLCRPPGEVDGGTGPLADLWRRLNDLGGYGLEAVIDAASAIPFETLGGIRELSEALGTRAGLAVDRLGPVPEDEVRQSLFIEARLDKPTRSGVQLGTTLRLSSEDSTFYGKRRDPAFGGRTLPLRFPSFVEGRAVIPLGRGRGSVSAAAAERAARATLTARREEFRQRVTEEVFRAALAYAALAAAERRVALLADSRDRHERILVRSEELLATGDLARADVDRLRGRLAAAREAEQAAMVALIAARQGLVDVLGIRADDLHAVPTTVPTDEVEPVQPQPLIDLALAERREPKAAAALVDAARALSQAAIADLRPRVSLDLRTGISTFYESPAYRFFPDEVDPVRSDLTSRVERDSPVGVGSIRGFSRIFRGAWKPYAIVSLSFELPFANRSARGRAEQADASLRQSAVQAREIERTIRTGVVQSARNMTTMTAAVQERRTAVERRRESLAAALEQFDLGDITTIDLLVTENDLTNEQVQLSQQQLLLQTALARYRFETGTLVAFRGVDSEDERVEVSAVPR